ncbi:MAG: diaminopimelate decarboxylase [Chlorobi bacterium]|nr:diaminopimelate decarboxylase [Chlorobiota bacterium]
MDISLLSDIARTYGTPAYVYDLQKVEERYRLLENRFHDLPLDIHYAVKANAHPAVLQRLRELGAGADCVSIHEVKHALQSGFEKHQILYTPACPSLDDLDEAFRLGVRVHIGALEYLDYVARNFPGRPIGLRLNPDITGGGNEKIATAHRRSKFGIPWTFSGRLMELIEKYGLHVEGLHVHIGSDVKSWKDLARGVDFLTDVAPAFPQLRYLDFGSGLKVPYRPGDKEMDVKAYADHIRKRMSALPGIRIKLEPGKFLTAQAGVFLMQVNVVKQIPGALIAGVNTGFHHMLRPMYYDAYHHIENISNPGGEPELYDVVGHLCEEDTFARNRRIAGIRPGDILALRNAGAYGFVMASRYNLHPLPKEIIIDGKKVYEQ